jgi:hypothetical protein
MAPAAPETSGPGARDARAAAAPSSALRSIGAVVGFELPTTSPWKSLGAKVFTPLIQTLQSAATAMAMIFAPELALLGYLVLGARLGAVAGTLHAAWNKVVEELGELSATGQLDESSTLWLARVLYERFEGQPTERVAALAHEALWSHRESSVSTDPNEFPVSDTLGGGAFRVERHLLGRGSQTLWMGSEVASGAGLLIACDTHSPRRHDVKALRQAVGYQLPGVFEFAYVGAFDVTGTDDERDMARASQWAMVEKADHRVGDRPLSLQASRALSWRAHENSPPPHRCAASPCDPPGVRDSVRS